MSGITEFSKWKSEWTKRIERDPAAKRAFVTLTSKGCSPEDLAEGVFQACLVKRNKLPTIFPIKHGRRNLMRSAEIFHKALSKNVALYPLLRGSVDIYREISLAVLEEYQRLAKEALHHLRALRSRRRKEGKVPIPDASLYSLWQYVKVATGRDHYRELVELIQPGDLVIGRDRPLSEEVIRRRIKRFEKKWPSFREYVGAHSATGRLIPRRRASAGRGDPDTLSPEFRP